MKKKLITQSDDLIAQGVAKKLIRIGEAVSQKLLADARQIIDTARANAVRSVDFNISHTLYAQLNWSQYKLLISIEDAQKHITSLRR